MSQVEPNNDYRIYEGDCLEILPTLAADSVDSVVTDPPYGLTFMGKDWDRGVPGEHFWKEILRVAKPGAHLLAFGGTRTYHRLVCAIEDAGWEIRDTIMWVYGSGFPKSLNAGRFAEKWDGWGTALKPACEPICLARKPLEGTVIENLSHYGTGALNIKACKVGTESMLAHHAPAGTFAGGPEGRGSDTQYYESIGRWPANLIHDGSDEAVSLFPYQRSGTRSSNYRIGGADGYMHNHGIYGKYRAKRYADVPASEGSAARFFYCAKANQQDRNEGLGGADGEHRTNNHPTVKPTDLMRYLCRLITPPNGIVLDPFMGSGTTGKACMLEGFRFIGVELDATYIRIAEARIQHSRKIRE